MVIMLFMMHIRLNYPTNLKLKKAQTAYTNDA